MPRRTPEGIGQSIDLVRWLYWQVLRRSPIYQREVDTLLARWLKDARLRIWQPRLSRAKKDLKRGRVQAVKAALSAYECLREGESIRGPYLLKRGKVILTGKINTAQELMMVLQDVDSHRFFGVEATGNSLPQRLSSGQTQDGLPELENFSLTWGLRFPIPPCVELILDEVMVNPWPRPVKISDKTPGVLTLTLYLPIGRETLLAFVGGALWHYLPKRRCGKHKGERLVSRKVGVKDKVDAKETEKTTCVRGLTGKRLIVSILLRNGKVASHKRDVLRKVREHLPKRSETGFQTKEDYEEILRIWDLRSRKLKPRTRKSIAKELRPHRKMDASAVYDLERAFKNLAKMFGIPL